jgi:antitoxin PrlF
LLPPVGWVVSSPGDYAAFKFPPLPRHDHILLDGEVRILRARPVLDLAGALKRPGQETVTLEEMEEAIAAGAVDPTQ